MDCLLAVLFLRYKIRHKLFFYFSLKRIPSS